MLTPLKRIGGKAALARWITRCLPVHRNYVEVFGGSAAVLFAKPRPGGVEVYNDLDGLCTNTLQVIRDDAERLAAKLAMTPYGRNEFNAAKTMLKNWREGNVQIDALELARLHIIALRQSFAADGAWSTELDPNRSRLWPKLPMELRSFSARLAAVLIEEKDYRELLPVYDREDTVYYVDPPYVGRERAYYSVNRRDGFDHETLREQLDGVQGSVVVSYYDSEYVRTLYSGWRVEERPATVDAGPRKRAENELLFIRESEYARQRRWRLVDLFPAAN